MARTKPAPHAPMSLQTWAMILFPAPMGSVASPVINWICTARKFLWPRPGPSQSPKRVVVPAPMARLDIREVEVNAIWGNSEIIVQQLADLLRELPVHHAGQPANAPDIHESRIPRTAGHLHGGLARGHHDVLLRLANGFSDDFGQRGQQ